MIIQKAQVTAKEAKKPQPVFLTLVQDEGGWTYSVDGVAGGELLLLWREKTAESASEALLERFAENAFHVEIVEER